MQCGWLSPMGDFYPCGYWEHDARAIELVNKYKYDIALSRYGNYSYDDTLMNNGWVRISVSIFGAKEQYISWEGWLTEYQKNFLKPYYEDNDIPVSCGGLCKWEMENDR